MRRILFLCVVLLCAGCAGLRGTVVPTPGTWVGRYYSFGGSNPPFYGTATLVVSEDGSSGTLSMTPDDGTVANGSGTLAFDGYLWSGTFLYGATPGTVTQDDFGLWTNPNIPVPTDINGDPIYQVSGTNRVITFPLDNTGISFNVVLQEPGT